MGGVGEDLYRAPQSVQDTVTNFLMRMVLVLSDVSNEEMSLQHAYACRLFGDALALWPTANVKLHYLDRMVEDKMRTHQQAAGQVRVGRGLRHEGVKRLWRMPQEGGEEQKRNIPAGCGAGEEAAGGKGEGRGR